MHLKVNDLYADLFTAKEPSKDSLFGVEREVEYRTDKTPITPKGWAIHSDGSLRYFGVEYISNPPVSRDKIKEHIEALWNVVDKENRIVGSPRTSCHVHYNVRDWTLQQVMNGAMLYWLFEPGLVSQFGQQREHNHFCWQMKDAHSFINTLYNEFTVYAACPLRNLSPVTGRNTPMRYAALNLSSLTTFGTVEFRAMHGDPSIAEMMRWINTIDAIMQHGKDNYTTPVEVLKAFEYDRPSLIKILFDGKRTMKYDDTKYDDMLSFIFHPLMTVDWNKVGVGKSRLKKNVRTATASTAVDVAIIDDRIDDLPPAEETSVLTTSQAESLRNLLRNTPRT